MTPNRIQERSRKVKVPVKGRRSVVEKMFNGEKDSSSISELMWELEKST